MTKSIISKHNKTINKFSTPQPQLEHKFSQNLDSKFESLTKRVSGTIYKIKKTLTTKIENELKN